jgi:hypothetical protein
MPGRYKPTAPELDFEEMALMNYDQDFLPADDNFSYWDSPDYYPEMYSFFPRDDATVGTAISPMTQCDVNSLNVPIDGPTHRRSGSSSSPFGKNGSFRFCDTFRNTEHAEIQDCKSSTMKHASLCGVKLQTTAHLHTCVPKIISLPSSTLSTEPSCSDDTENETAVEPAPRKRRRPNIKRASRAQIPRGSKFGDGAASQGCAGAVAERRSVCYGCGKAEQGDGARGGDQLHFEY